MIIKPLTHAKYASRSLKKGVTYAPPPEAIDPRELSGGSLNEILASSDHALIRTLASRVNLGRVYGSAACSIAGIDEDAQSNSLTEEQKSSLGMALSKMLGNLDEGEVTSGYPTMSLRMHGTQQRTSQIETQQRLE